MAGSMSARRMDGKTVSDDRLFRMMEQILVGME